jgi:hypothetical protein
MARSPDDKDEADRDNSDRDEEDNAFGDVDAPAADADDDPPPPEEDENEGEPPKLDAETERILAEGTAAIEALNAAKEGLDRAKRDIEAAQAAPTITNLAEARAQRDAAWIAADKAIEGINEAMTTLSEHGLEESAVYQALEQIYPEALSMGDTVRTAHPRATPVSSAASPTLLAAATSVVSPSQVLNTGGSSAAPPTTTLSAAPPLLPQQAVPNSTLLAAATRVIGQSQGLNTAGSSVALSTTTLSAAPPLLPQQAAQHAVSRTAAAANMQGIGAVSNAEWAIIKAKIEDIHTPAKVIHNGNIINVTDPEHSIERNPNGVSITSTQNPPDSIAMVRSFKATGKTQCDINGSAGPTTTADLIIELHKSPSVIPNLANNVLQELEAHASTDAKCKQALDIYQKIIADNNLTAGKRGPNL